MRNIIIAVMFMVMCSNLVLAQKKVIIKGTISGDLKGYDKLYVPREGVKRDSALVRNGNFEITLPFTKPFLAHIQDEYSVKVKHRGDGIAIFIDRPGVIYLKDIAIEKGLKSGKISGIKSAVDFQSYNTSLMHLTNETTVLLQKKYGDTITPKSPNFKAYVADFQKIYTPKELDILKRFIKGHPGSYTSVYILNEKKYSLTLTDLEAMYKTISESLRGSEEGKLIADYMKGIRSSGIGKIVRDFTLNNQKDEAFKFSQLKGKYVLIDFWASWCEPCKASFPDLKEIYSKYKGEKFEFYSISIDKSKAAWLNELKKQELPWLQSLDTKNISSSVFGVTAVPTTFLIDPNGKIILKAVGFDPNKDSPLNKKIIEIFGAK